MNEPNYYNRLAAIAAVMDGTHWNADTLDTIASVLRESGFTLREPDDDGGQVSDSQHLASCQFLAERWYCAADCPLHVIVDIEAEKAAHVYNVSTTCDGTINEVWEVRSPRPLTRDELEDLNGLHSDDAVTITFKTQETNDEENRTVTSIDVERGELLDACDECGAGIPDHDGGTLENKHHDPSCSLYDADKE